MAFIISLIVMCGMVLLFDNAIKKAPAYFYIGAFVLNLIAFIIYKNAALSGFLKNVILAMFTTGYVGIAGFYIVMFTGALNAKGKLIKKLMKIRGELSIISSILMLSHIVIFGPQYIEMAVKNANTINGSLLFSIICGTILLIQTIYLGITSVKAVRRKMKAKTWKNLQRTAYLFYFLMYIHGVTMQANKCKNADFDAVIIIVAYSCLFFTYVIMRVRKYLLSKYKRIDIAILNRFSKIGTSIVSIIAIIVVVSITYVNAANYNVANQKKIERKRQQMELEAMINSDLGEIAADDNNEVVSEKASSEAVSEEANTEANSEVSSDNVNSIEAKDSKGLESAKTSNDSNGDLASTNNQNSQANSNVEANEAAISRTYKSDGTYSASATVEDYFYNITVYVVISNDKVSKVYADISDASDLDYEYAERAAGGLSASGMNAVSGATFSSKAIKSAYNAAIAKAKG